MSDDRREGNVFAFLWGFALGALLAGGAGGGYLLLGNARLHAEAARAADEAAYSAAIAAEQEELARSALEVARLRQRAAEEALARMREGKKP